MPFDLSALKRYTDVEALLVAWLADGLGDAVARVSTEMPPLDLLAENLPYVQVEAFGGADINPAQDVARVDIDVYVGPDDAGNPDRASASDLAEQIRAAMLTLLPGYHVGPATVQAVATFARPSARPYDDDQSLRRFGASYEVTVATRD